MGLRIFRAGEQQETEILKPSLVLMQVILLRRMERAGTTDVMMESSGQGGNRSHRAPAAAAAFDVSISGLYRGKCHTINSRGAK